MGSCRAQLVYLTTRLLGRLSPLSGLTSIVHILSPEIVNCPSWISGRERMTVENIPWSISTKECCRPRRGGTRDLLVSSRTAHPIEPPRPAPTGWNLESGPSTWGTKGPDLSFDSLGDLAFCCFHNCLLYLPYVFERTRLGNSADQNQTPLSWSGSTPFATHTVVWTY